MELNHVKQLVLTSSSSNVEIQNLLGSAIIDDTIGNLNILNIDDTFSNLNIILQNSDANIMLPKSNYNVYFKGNKSKLNNEFTSKKTIDNYPNSTNTSNKTIMVNAKYSNVAMQ